jgi:hypothetical protein
MAVLIKRDQAVGGGDAEQNRGAGDQHADPQKPSDDRNEQPVAEVGDEVGLAPPWPAGIAGPEPGQHREHQSQRQRNRHALEKRLANIDDEREQFLRHVVTLAARLGCRSARLLVSGVGGGRRSRYRRCALMADESKRQRGRFRLIGSCDKLRPRGLRDRNILPVMLRR